MNTKNRNLILLTATVNPMTDVARANPKVRLNDYLSALKIWWGEFESLAVDILFCENSGYDIKIIEDWILSINAENRIKIFQFIGDKSLVEKLGKGAGEAEIFDECIKRSFINEYQYILKSTGRLFVKNSKLLLKNALDHSYDWSIAIRGDLEFVDTRFFIIRSEIFKSHLINLSKDVDDRQGVYLEHVIMKSVFKAMSVGYRWGQFAELPSYLGVGGTDGKQHASIIGKLRFFVKNSLHKAGVRWHKYWYL